MNTNEYEIDLATYETILLQQEKLPYSIATVQDAVYCLNVLTQLDFNKKKRYRILARPMIQAFLYNNYSFDFLCLFENYETVCRDLSKRADFSNQDIKYLKIYNRETPTKSIRSHINIFFDFYRAFSENSPFPSNSSFEMNKSRFYIQLSQSPELLLLFSYFDNRNLSENKISDDIGKLPRYKGSSSDIKSYQKLVSRIETLVNSNDDFFSKNVILYNADKIFLCYRLNILISYYDLYASDSFLTPLISKYRLTYKDVLRLRDCVTNTIFMDENFIRMGLQSNFPDFMLLFHIHFMYHISFYFPEQLSRRDLIKDIKAAKQFALSHFDTICPNPITPDSRILCKVDNPAFEENIINQLNENAFFQKYLSPVSNSSFGLNHPMLKYFPTWNDIEQRFITK